MKFDGDTEGRFERCLPIDQWDIPGVVEVEGELLRWTLYSRKGHQPRLRSSGPGLLEEFLQLEEGTPAHILSYARKWGILSFCKRHKLPASHKFNGTKQALDFSTAYFNQCELDWFKEGGQIWYQEPLELWRKYAKVARTICRLASNLHSRKLGNVDDWAILSPDAELEAWFQDPQKRLDQKLCEGKLLVAFKLQEWLQLGRVKVTPYWGVGNPTIKFGSRRLFGALALQLCFVVSRSEGFELCSSCGDVYLPTRPPKPEKRHYCKPCRDRGRPKADASRDYWRRTHQAKQ